MGQRYLVTLSLGPVQGLIGAARRTRDLWCGSWLLSEAARAAARSLDESAPGGLIFPAMTGDELLPQRAPGSEANLSNILRAEVVANDEAAVRQLCQRAKEGAARRLVELGEEVRRQLPGLRDPVWQAQIDDLLEGFAAWVRIDDGDYAGASARLGAVLAARKATRDTMPAQRLTEQGLPKSSLDGAGETVLPQRVGAGVQRRLALSAGEQLDALGVLKRFGGDPEQFTAYSRIAADPWLEGLTQQQADRLSAAYEPLVGLEVATRVKGNHGCYRRFPYDAQLLFDFRLENALARASSKNDEQYQPQVAEALTQLRDELQAVMREPGESGGINGAPVPYAVILQADGDRMGELLTRARSAEESRAISIALHRFASAVREEVRQHRGHAIYAGGDDVLALVPLPQATVCARSLAERFATEMGGVARELMGADDKPPTLSVGLGIGHLVEPLGTLRERALRAERVAKGDPLPEKERRNALAVIVGSRSGGDTAWRAGWSDIEALNELQHFTTAYRQGQLPSRVAYDLRSIDQRLAWLRGDRSDIANGMRLAEVARMLDRARTRGDGRLDAEQARQLQDRAGKVPLAALADTLIIARWLGARTASEVSS